MATLSTQLTLNLLTQLEGNLLSYLVGLGLLKEGETLINIEDILGKLSSQSQKQFLDVLDEFEKLTSDVNITNTQFEQLFQENQLVLANYSMDLSRYQSLTKQQENLTQEIDQLSQYKIDLTAYFQKLETQIDGNINSTEDNILNTENEITNFQFVDPKTLIKDTNLITKQITQQETLLANYQTQFNNFSKLQTDAQNLANHYANIGWKRSYSWLKGGYLYQDPEIAKLSNLNQNLAILYGQNANQANKMIGEINQQITALSSYKTAIEEGNNVFNNSTGKFNDASQILAVIQKQNSLAQAIEKNAFDQVALVELQRVQNQDLANWYNSQINQLVKVNGFGNKIKEQNHPEYRQLRDIAQNLANQTNQSFINLKFQSTAQKAQLENNNLSKLTNDLETRLYQHFPAYKDGIKAEIAAYLMQWQNQQNLQFIEKLTHQQQLDLLDLRIDQAKEDLTKLTTDFTAQKVTLDTSQKHLLDIQAQWETLLKDKANIDDNLRNFVDTNGFFLSESEKLEITQTILDKNQDYLDQSKQIIDQLEKQLQGNSNTVLEQQLQDYLSFVDNLENNSNWATVQQANFNYLTPDPEEKTQITDLINNLISLEQKGTEITGFSIDKAVNFLQNIQEIRSNLLTSFDDLQEVVTVIENEKNSVTDLLKNLQKQYGDLSQLETEKTTEKSDLLQDITAKTEAIKAIENNIEENQSFITQSQTELNSLKAIKIEKETVIKGLQQEICTTQNKLDSIPDLIKVTQTEIQRQKDLLALLDKNNSLLNQATLSEQQAAYYWNLSRKSGLYSPVTEQTKVKSRIITQTITRLDPNWQQWDTLTKQATALRQQATNNQIVIDKLMKSGVASQAQVSNIEQEIVSLQKQQQSLQNELIEDQKQLTNVNKEIEINQKLIELPNKIDNLEKGLEESQQILLNQEKTLKQLEISLNITNQLLGEIPEQLSDKSAEISLTQKYVAILESEFNRLSIPNNLFKDFSASQTEFTEDYSELKSVTKIANNAVQKLADLRQEGEIYRSQLADLNSQLKTKTTDLETKLTASTEDEQTANSLQKDLALIELQLGNQQLHLNSLNQQKTPLLSAEAYFNRLADYYRGKIYQGNFDAYKSALEKASLIHQQYNNVLAEITTTEDKIKALTTQKNAKTALLTEAKSDLISSDPEITQLKTDINNISVQIEQVNTNLKPLQELEDTEIKAFFTAMEKGELLSNNLEQLTQDQVDLSKQLIELGLIASESDINFFEEEIQSRINQFKLQLEARNQDFSSQLQAFNTLITNWQEVLTNNPDPVISNVINSLISSIEKQEQTLTNFQSENTVNLTTLETNFETALASLKLLREQQKIDLLDDLENNQKVQEALSAQLGIEKALNTAINTNTIEGLTELNKTLSELLKDKVNQWTTDLKSGNLENQDLWDIKQNFSTSFDDLITEIKTKLADVQGEYELNTTQLEEALRIVDVLIGRQDILAQSVDSTEDAIALITKQLAQAQELQEKIGHFANLYELENDYRLSKAEKTNPLLIAELITEINELPKRYGLESEELKDYLDHRISEIQTQQNQDEKIKQLQTLRLELAYFDVKFDQGSEILQQYLQGYEKIELAETQKLSELAQDTPIINSNITAINYAINSHINYNPNQVRLTNIDGDQNLEALVFRPGSGIIFASEADGNGQMTTLFNSNSGLAGYNLLSPSDGVVTFDYDGDNKTDVFLYRPGRGAAWVAHSNGNGTFTATYAVGDDGAAGLNGIAGYNFLAPNGLEFALAFDYNGDNKDDLFFYRPGTGAAWVARSEGNGSFTGVYTMGAPGYGIAGYDMRSPADRVISLDYNGDGKDDLFLYRPGRGCAWVARSEGNGQFTPVYAVGDDGAAGLNGIGGFDLLSPSDIALSFDYNGDGKDDLFLYRPGAGAAYIARSNGNGTFTHVYGSGNGIAGFDFLGASDRAFAYDYDADGDDDLFFYRLGVNNVWIARSNGDGTFSNLGRADANGIIQYEKNEITSKTNSDIKALRDKLLPGFDQDIASKVVNGEIPDQLNNYLGDLEELKNSITKKGASATSALIQADWYESEAAKHWDLSHKQGPTWSEFRRTYTRRLWGGKKWKTVEIKHVDHHWIVWDNYTQLAAMLRNQAISNITDIPTLETEKQNLEELIAQWKEAYKQAGIADETWQEVYNTLHQLFANQDLGDDQQAQLDLLQQLLPTLEDQFALAQTQVDQANAQLSNEWTEYESSSAQYIEITKEIAPLIANLDRKAEEVYQQIDEVQKSLEQQNLGLDLELKQTLNLQQTLAEQLALIAEQLKIPLLSTEEIADLKTKQALFEQASELIGYKATILEAQQTYLKQQEELLNTQKNVLATEENLVNAYLESPDNDWSNLEQQLENARNTLAEMQKLAEQAKASSELLTTPLTQLTSALFLQNDEHLTAVQTQQTLLKDLITATELNKNLTLEAAVKKEELNNLEIEALQRLQDIAEAGSQEAQYLRDVAHYNDFGTAFEIYYRDYRDLTTDQKSSSAGGLATAQDWVLADHYYEKMIEYQQLEREAQQQANSFMKARETAEDQLTLINENKVEAQKELELLNERIATTQEEIDAKNQELSITQNRINILEELQSRTQETLSELIKIEQFYLKQAQLEQQLAQLYYNNIDEALADQLERDYLTVQLQRQQATEKIQYLAQLQSLDDLESALNNLRSELGVESFDGLVTEAQKQVILAGLLPELNNAQQQANLPDEIKTLLTSTETAIHDALQGAEASDIQEKLLNTTQSLFEEVNTYNTQIAQLETENQQDYLLLQKAETDLQNATRQLYEQIALSDTFKAEKELLTEEQLNVLYQVGYAQQGVTISNSLAEKSKQIIEQIVEARIVEREIRKKAFLNELITVIGISLSVLGTAFSLAAAAPFFAASATILKTISLTINLVNGVFKAAQSAYNGDWLGAVYGLTMAVTSFVSGNIKLGLNGCDCSILGMSRDVAQDVLSKINTFQPLVSGLYNTIRSLESGDEIGAFLNVVGALSSVALDHLGLEKDTFSYQLINSLRNVPLMIHNGIQAFESDNWLSGINNIFNAVITLGQNFSNLLPETIFPQVADVLSKIKFGGNVGLSLATAIDNNSFSGWLDGINSILGSWQTYKEEQKNLQPFKVHATLENIVHSPEIQNFLAEKGLSADDFLANVEENWQKISFPISNNHNGTLNSLGEIDPTQKTFVIVHGYMSSGDGKWVITMGLILKAQNPDANIMLVDWRELADNPLYPLPANSSINVGDNLAQTLYDLGVNFENTTIIGHSLGAQVAANVGEYAQTYYNQKLDEIIGLDPARPKFNYSSVDDRLDANDAQKVTVIHSDYNGLFPLGYDKSAGSAGIGYRQTSDGWQQLGSNDLYLNKADNQYYNFSNNGGIDHQDAYGFYIDYLLHGSSTVQDFFTTIHSEIAPAQVTPIQKMLESVKIEQLSVNNNADSLTGFNMTQTLVGTDQIDLFQLSNYFTISDLQEPILIQNFDPNNDQIQLTGTLENYSLGATTQDLPSGTGIYFNNGGENQLIAVIEGQNNLSLTQNNFSFVTD